MRKKEGTEFVAWRRVLAAFVRHVARNDRWKGEKKGGRSVDADESGSNYREDGGSSVGIWERVDPVLQWRREEEIAEPSDVLRMTSGSSPSSAAKKETREPCWTRTISYDPGSVLPLGGRSGREWN